MVGTLESGESGSSCGRTMLLAGSGSSRGRVDDPFVFRQMAPDWKVGLVEVPEIVVPLLSQEGLTCRLLPGATAPYPALDLEFSLLAAAAALNCFVLMQKVDRLEVL